MRLSICPLKNSKAAKSHEFARSATPNAQNAPYENRLSSSSNFSWVISASCDVPRSFTTYVHRP